MIKFLGRIYKEGEALFFAVGKKKGTRVNLSSVLSKICQNPLASNQEVVGQVGVSGFKPSDVETARLYHHRFGCDVGAPNPLPDNRVLLLDECISPRATLALSESFGWASHVELEGLAGKRTPDHDIWHFADRNQFAAVVTRDSDFLYIVQHDRPENPPFLIHVLENLEPEGLCDLFGTNAAPIRQIMERGTAIGCSLSLQNGCKPIV